MRRHATAAQAPSAPGPATSRGGRSRGPRPAIGEERYLWILVALEVGLTALLRNRSRGHHGG